LQPGLQSPMSYEDIKNKLKDNKPAIFALLTYVLVIFFNSSILHFLLSCFSFSFL